MSVRYFKHPFLLEITLSVFIMVIIGIFAYFFYLQSTITQCESTIQHLRAQQLALIQKKLLATADQRVQHALKRWQHKHPRWYAAIQSGQTLDQALQLLTHTAQQTTFTLIQIQPLVIKKKHFIQLALTGSYLNLFDFMQPIIQSPWPITLYALNIPQAGQLDVTFSVRGVSD